MPCSLAGALNRAGVRLAAPSLWRSISRMCAAAWASALVLISDIRASSAERIAMATAMTVSSSNP